MSMFHELMMRNKEEIMYATIKGSLTESPEGVFSGFSASNYLQIDNALPTTIGNKYVFEGETEITATSTSGRYIFSFFCNRKSATSVFGLLYRSSGYFAVAETNGTQEFVHQGTIAYQINTKYKYKVETDLNTYIRVYINDVLDISVSLSYNNISAYDGTMYYGIYANENNLPLTNGSINLNNTSVKINSTKYKLQAVVGYTVVGSPTITDGVVSGFSGTDYVQIPNPKIDNTLFEFFVSFAMGNDMTGQQNLLTENNLNMRLYKLTSDSCFKFRFYDKNASDNLVVTLDYTIQANTSYKYKVRYNNSILIIAIYDNANNLLAENSISNVSPLINDQIKIGSLGTSNGYLKGSIDLNNTYIKINNKLWFNGQEG